eukprot:6316767-Prymnesium_polylepis.1
MSPNEPFFGVSPQVEMLEELIAQSGGGAITVPPREPGFAAHFAVGQARCAALESWAVGLTPVTTPLDDRAAWARPCGRRGTTSSRRI